MRILTVIHSGFRTLILLPHPWVLHEHCLLWPAAVINTSFWSVLHAALESIGSNISSKQTNKVPAKKSILTLYY